MKLILLGFRILAAIAVLVGAESIFDTNATAIVQWLITTPTCSVCVDQYLLVLPNVSYRGHIQTDTGYVLLEHILIQIIQDAMLLRGTIIRTLPAERAC